MHQPVKSLINIALLATVAAFTMGVESCSEPKEFCKYYTGDTDRAECTDFCKSNKDFKSAPNRKDLITACENGQMGYLNNIRVAAAEAMLACDRHFELRDIAAACRAGVTAEELRVAKSRNSAGSSNDRETGNNR